MVWINQVKADVTFQHLRHQSIDGSPASRNRVEDFRAFSSSFQAAFDRFDLSTNPPDSIQEFLLVSKYMGHSFHR
jgi:hypothetical protein